MAKKSKGKQYVSKGIVGHPMKTAQNSPKDRILNQVKAWKQGKKVMLTIPSVKNPSIMERVSATEIWGSPKSNKMVIETEQE